MAQPQSVTSVKAAESAPRRRRASAFRGPWLPLLCPVVREQVVVSPPCARDVAVTGRAG